MLPTPSTSHVNYDHIYEPAEDSFLMLDTLSSPPEIKYLQSRFPRETTPTPLVLEIGTGSGVILAFTTAHAKQILGRSEVATLGVDINHFASVATGETIRNAVVGNAAISTTNSGGAGSSNKGVFLDALVGDLASCVRERTVDVLIFNPPYVPSETVPPAPLQTETTRNESAGASSRSFERDSHMLYLSTDGGVDGMEVTDRLLDRLPSILSDRGVAYILLCAQNKPEVVMARIGNWRDDSGEWVVEKVGSSGQKAGWERLCIIRIARARAG